ncbi:sulfotransferase family protein [Cryomorpha ignava]|uniref:Sulfotransferase family protein n=2 Tax=Cryomorpha ignava TaxID=101383 RepID=A0A7K3WRT8_9FLAO|nr:sulfotransferase family protein [Cryomorpha ignava]
MYAFAQRGDTLVFDEPLYAHYLRSSDAKVYHPLAQEVLDTMENDGNKVVEMMLGKAEKPVLFFKQMTHHLINIDWAFLPEMINVILTRDPREMLPSYAKEIENPTMSDVGYAMHIELLEYLEANELPIIILDSKSILQSPENQLKKLCAALAIPFDEAMLTWVSGPIPEDGVWAKHWYGNVHKSTGFQPYEPKTSPFPERLKPLLNECLPLYERLKRISLS